MNHDNPYTENGLSYNIVSGKPEPGRNQSSMNTGGLFGRILVEVK